MKQKIKIPIRVKGSQTAHLNPIVDYLRSMGNETWYDEFSYDKGGPTLYFKSPINQKDILDNFELPETIGVDRHGSIIDDRNGIKIIYYPTKPDEDAF